MRGKQNERPRVLIEDWLPVAKIGAESQRERSAANASPGIYFLHVWWARRPLTASRAAVLSSVLPSFSDDWPKDLKGEFPTEKSYHDWFLRLIGITGDPVAGRRLIQYAKEKGVKLPGNPYGYTRAFTNDPGEDDLELMGRLLEVTWGDKILRVCDPMAGGGSIPFEALRYGFATYANELNPVASVILKATLDYPARFGTELLDLIKEYGNRMVELIEERLNPYFPRQRNESIFAYIWARTVACPTTGKSVPLSPNWWLEKGSNPVAAKVLVESRANACRFEILHGRAATNSKPDDGTISRGTAVSPWTGDPIEGDYIKAEAQAGRMGQQLYAIRVKTADGNEFREPTETDLKAVALAEKELRAKLPRWEAKGLVPIEEIPVGNKTSEPRRYGIYKWSNVFSPRQLLSLCTYLEVFHEVMKEARKELSKDMADAVQTYLAFSFDKACDRNSYMARWITQRQIIANTFDRHDFSFKWSHAEMNLTMPGLGYDWALSQVVDAYSKISEFVKSTQHHFFKKSKENIHEQIGITRGNAQNLSHLKTGSVHLVCVDPPYYDNVMYSECSDFFYVWMKPPWERCIPSSSPTN